MSDRRHTGRLAALVLPVLLVLIPFGEAGAAQIRWPTYMHAGPGQQYAVIDELSRDETLRVQGCAAGWCRVMVGDAVGYVEAEAVASAATPPEAARPQPATREGCFLTLQQGYPRGDATRFCPR